MSRSLHATSRQQWQCSGSIALKLVCNMRQAMGEWTQEEHELFMHIAREHGVGDRWGLFASHIPQRVGYQCSAYYRDCIIARGFVFDPRFKMARSGTPVFVG